ncbi:MAG: GIY-YIG nuclease family protein [Myxococcales bacterium]|nr:GIY-YIG nuclease family protein [Myxococcales bacterium]
MAETTIKMEFEGYWRDVNSGGIPSASGVYSVYAATHDAREKTVDLKRLLYIGEAADVGDRIRNHERRADWTRQLRTGEVLCFAIGRVASTIRNRAEAALIFKHQPPLNTSCTEEFKYDRTTMSLSGQCALLTTYFTVERTHRAAWR